MRVGLAAATLGVACWRIMSLLFYHSLHVFPGQDHRACSSRSTLVQDSQDTTRRPVTWNARVPHVPCLQNPNAHNMSHDALCTCCHRPGRILPQQQRLHVSRHSPLHSWAHPHPDYLRSQVRSCCLHPDVPDAAGNFLTDLLHPHCGFRTVQRGLTLGACRCCVVCDAAWVTQVR